MGTLIWTLRATGRLEATASSILGSREAASLIHWQAPCLSATVGVFFWRLENPAQHCLLGVPPLAMYGRHGARKDFTWSQGMDCPGSIMITTTAAATITATTTHFFFNSLGWAPCLLSFSFYVSVGYGFCGKDGVVFIVANRDICPTKKKVMD